MGSPWPCFLRAFSSPQESREPPIHSPCGQTNDQWEQWGPLMPDALLLQETDNKEIIWKQICNFFLI